MDDGNNMKIHTQGIQRPERVVFRERRDQEAYGWRNGLVRVFWNNTRTIRRGWYYVVIANSDNAAHSFCLRMHKKQGPINTFLYWLLSNTLNPWDHLHTGCQQMLQTHPKKTITQSLPVPSCLFPPSECADLICLGNIKASSVVVKLLSMQWLNQGFIVTAIEPLDIFVSSEESVWSSPTS